MPGLFFPTSFITYLAVFLLGVLCLPVGLALAAWYIYKTLPNAPSPDKSTTPFLVPLEEHDRFHRQAEEAIAQQKAEFNTFYKVGWLRITREERPDEDVSTLKGLVKLGITSIMETKQQQANRLAKDRYFVTLKYDTLFLYDSEQQAECRGVVVVPYYQVAIHPRNLPDNEVFHKDLPILLSKTIPGEDEEPPETTGALQDSYYIYADTPTVKEDWYFALSRASRLHPRAVAPSSEKQESKGVPHEDQEWGTSDQADPFFPLGFDQHALQDIHRTIQADDPHIQTQWLNAVIGRVFLSVYRTDMMKQYFINKIRLKITKLKKPSFLGNIEVRDLSVGDGVPSITNPRLLSLDERGELKAEMYVHYAGGFRCEIETEVQLSVTSRLKSLRVPLVLAIVLKRLTGKILLQIKPPPSNRFWVGFYETPSMDLCIEPIVSEKQVKFGMVIQAIERRIYDVINETIVLPNMDDTPFFASEGLGGIFENFIRQPLLSHPVANGETTPTEGLSQGTLSGNVPAETESEQGTAASTGQGTSQLIPASDDDLASGTKQWQHNTSRTPSLRSSATTQSGPAAIPSGGTSLSSRALSLLKSIKAGQPTQPPPESSSPLQPLDIPAGLSKATTSTTHLDSSSTTLVTPDLVGASHTLPKDSSVEPSPSGLVESHPDSTKYNGVPRSPSHSPSLLQISPSHDPAVTTSGLSRSLPTHGTHGKPPSEAAEPVTNDTAASSHLQAGHHDPKSIPPLTHSPTWDYPRPLTAVSPPRSPTLPYQPLHSLGTPQSTVPMGRGQPIPHGQPRGQGIPHSEAHLYGLSRGRNPTGLGGRRDVPPSVRRSWLTQMIPDSLLKSSPPSPTKPERSERTPEETNEPVHSTDERILHPALTTDASTTAPPGRGNLATKLAWFNQSIESLKHTYQQHQIQLQKNSLPKGIPAKPSALPQRPPNNTDSWPTDWDKENLTTSDLGGLSNQLSSTPWPADLAKPLPAASTPDVRTAGLVTGNRPRAPTATGSEGFQSGTRIPTSQLTPSISLGAESNGHPALTGSVSLPSPPFPPPKAVSPTGPPSTTTLVPPTLEAD
ncbi:hypothetical protein IWQ62_000434 [Dispira parvispora]|uniref:SMP-LTD domain-containing protein n=1 Tax=Dispira parvispora TaxID=1520584 RepID=A0A9W8E511_9FUNG|nr:hypothetical protein IWQ62_000434 [Dispira parvispora]